MLSNYFDNMLILILLSKDLVWAGCQPDTEYLAKFGLDIGFLA